MSPTKLAVKVAASKTPKAGKPKDSLVVLERNAKGLFEIHTTVNGLPQTWEVSPHEYLLDTLRRVGYKGAKKGCETGDCGTCTVLLDGKAVASCLFLAAQAHGRHITTIEALGTPDHPHPLQKAFAETGATQCGFCIPGMILSSYALLQENPKPSEEAIRLALDGNLCRCTGYVKQVEAVQKAAAESSK